MRCMHACMRAFTYADAQLHWYMHACMYARRQVMHVCMHAVQCMHACECACIHVMCAKYLCNVMCVCMRVVMCFCA